MRMIDSEPIEKFIENGLNEHKFGYDAIEIMAEVHYAPTVDAVEVVRCKDCMNYIRMMDLNSLTPRMGCNKSGLYPNRDGYCSYGEKKEGVDHG